MADPDDMITFEDSLAKMKAFGTISAQGVLSGTCLQLGSSEADSRTQVSVLVLVMARVVLKIRASHLIQRYML